MKLTQQNCNRIKSDGCTICLLDAKIAFGCFIFYILLSLSLSFCSVCAAREKSLPELLLMQPPSVPWEPVRSLWICSQTRCKTHTHRKADVCAKGHLPPNLCTNTPEHQCLVRQRTNISPPLESTHTPHRLRYHVLKKKKIIRLKWIESAGLCSHERTSGTERWRGIIMSPHSSECYGTES